MLSSAATQLVMVGPARSRLEAVHRRLAAARLGRLHHTPSGCLREPEPQANAPHMPAESLLEPCDHYVRCLLRRHCGRSLPTGWHRVG